MYLTADFDLSALVSPTGSLNYGRWQDLAISALLDRLRQAQDGMRQVAADGLSRYLVQCSPIAPICFKNGSVLTQYGRWMESPRCKIMCLPICPDGRLPKKRTVMRGGMKMSVYRCYSEKRPGFDVEAQGLCRQLKEQLGVKGLESVRILNRYDADRIDPRSMRPPRAWSFPSLRWT